MFRGVRAHLWKEIHSFHVKKFIQCKEFIQLHFITSSPKYFCPASKTMWPWEFLCSKQSYFLLPPLRAVCHPKTLFCFQGLPILTRVGGMTAEGVEAQGCFAAFLPLSFLGCYVQWFAWRTVTCNKKKLFSHTVPITPCMGLNSLQQKILTQWSMSRGHWIYWCLDFVPTIWPQHGSLLLTKGGDG